jgi:hypothetical protein
MVVEEMLRTPFPVLVSVTLFAALTVFCVWLPKFRVVVLKVAIAIATPVPLRAAFCGEPVASSEIVKAALVGAAAVGVNTSETAHAPAGASVAPQVFAEIAYCAAFAPVSVMAAMFRVAVPGLLTVIALGALDVPTVWFANARPAGLNAILGVPNPVPVNDTVWGEPVASSETVKAALVGAAAAGVKTTETAHAPAGARVAPQVFAEIAYCAAFAPVSVRAAMFSVAVPGLLTVIPLATLDVPTV